MTCMHRTQAMREKKREDKKTEAAARPEHDGVAEPGPEFLVPNPRKQEKKAHKK